MTTEEKARAYDEALTTAKRIISKNCSEVEELCLKCVFPELAESEDEKMLREIKRYLKEQGDKPTGLPNGTVAVSDMIAWLEKQKDANKAIEAVDRIDKYIDENVANAHDMKDSNPDKKYYRGWDDALGEMARILQDVYSDEKQKERRDYRKLYEDITKSEWFKEIYEGKSLGEEQPTEILKEQKPAEINEYEIIKKHITEDVISSEVNKRLKECGWYVTDEKPAEWDDYTKTNLDRALQIIKKAKGTLQGYQSDDGIYECDKAIECLEHFLYRGLEIEKSTKWNKDYREEDIQTRFAFYTYKDEPSTLYLSNVFVEETNRNKGFGTKILVAAEKVAETLGMTSIRLKVKRDSPANAWYRKHGYSYMTFDGDYDWFEKNIECMKPNKQEWSEKDEVMLNNIIWGVHMKSIKPLDEMDDRSKYEKYEDFLKSLPERFNLQPKQEWNEEDERKYQCIRNILLTDMYKRVGSWKYSEILEWYEKRGINRYTNSESHWKPTEEQMKALRLSFEEAFDDAGDCNRYRELKSIYEQLNKRI